MHLYTPDLWTPDGIAFMSGQTHCRADGLSVKASLLTLSLLMIQCGCGGAKFIPAETENSGTETKAHLRTTDKVEEFRPEAGQEVVSNKVEITNPITGALEAYQPMKRQIAALGIEHAVNLFQASEGRYPKDFEEFKARIIEENKIRLPALPQGLSYQYDVENHKLVVVRDDTGNKVE
jgi:hypothetical protein